MRDFFLFCPSLDIWISHMLKVVVYRTTIQKYINYKTKCKTDRLIVKGLTTGRQMRVLFVDGLSSYNGERDARLGV